MAQRREAQLMTEHVLSHLAQHKAESRSPLFVAVQGPQGIGKTFLTSILHDVLTVPPHALRVAVLSIDDLYLPHDALSALAQAHPENKLLHGRGMPGTHDVPLGTRALRALKDINNAPTADDASPVKSVTLPVFDKSLYGGEGDRLPESAGKVVCAPVDVVMLEGWCVGFCPIANDVLEKRWEAPVQGLDAFDMRRFTKQNLGIVNEMLEAYIDWWTLFDIFIQISPIQESPYACIYKWRLEQEHFMKSRNGGKGMSDEQVSAFVDRYIPGYVLFSDGVTKGSLTRDDWKAPSWKGKGLRITVDENRDFIASDRF